MKYLRPGILCRAFHNMPDLNRKCDENKCSRKIPRHVEHGLFFSLKLHSLHYLMEVGKVRNLLLSIHQSSIIVEFLKAESKKQHNLFVFQSILAMLEACILKKNLSKKIPRRAMPMTMHTAPSSQYYGKRFLDNERLGSLSHTWWLKLTLISLSIYFQSRN